MPVEFCPRQIIFDIPGSPGVQVTATENLSGGIDFVVDVLDGSTITGDLRALFFDFTEAKLDGLTITDGSGLITETQVDANDVIDLGNGANLKGATKAAFDVGIEWGTQGIGHDDDIHDPVSFTLSREGDVLTLDDIAHQRFGARVTSTGSPDGSRGGSEKLLIVAPAAPDANDDSYTIFEDNSASLDDPSKTPTNYVMHVLLNDTDADAGDVLTIIDIHEQPDHGTVSITDGGTTITYAPELDYAGQVSFEYCISDGNGGQDHATVTIDLTPVADIPLFNVVVEGTDNVNEVLITVTVTQNDDDSSEFIDSITTSALPAGASIVPVSDDPAGQPDFITREFLLTLVPDNDYDFDVTFTGTAEETGNADQQTATYVVPIVYEYNTTTVGAQFAAEDQSIWGSGDEFVFDDNRFLGIDTGDFGGTIGFDFLYAGFDGHALAGFQSDLHFEGGSIDATADYDLTVATNYNKTVDTLRIDTGALLQSALFSTEGPEGSYKLDFVYDIALHAYVAVDISVDLFVTEVGYQDSFDIVNENWADTINLLDLNSDDLSVSFDFPAPFNAFSIDLAWPNLTTNGSLPPNPGTSSGASNNFLQLNADMDTLITQLLGVPNFFDPPAVSLLGIASIDADLLDFDISGGLNFLQDFELAMGNLVGTLTFEDGSSQAFTLGNSLQLTNASDIDANTLDPGGPDGIVDFVFSLSPESELTNDTALGFNIGFHLKLLELTASYDVGVASGSETFGPLYEDNWNFPIAEIPVYNDTFDLAFSSGNFAFAA